MATNKNTIPAGLYAYFVETDVFAAGEFAAGLDVEERGNRVVIHADAATLAAFGDYIWSVAGLVEDRIRTRAEVGYGWKQLKEISKRFPTRDEAAAEMAEAAAADETAEAAGGYRRVHPGIGRLTDETAPAAVKSGTVTAARGTYRLRSLHREVHTEFRPLGSWKLHARGSRRETLIAA